MNRGEWRDSITRVAWCRRFVHRHRAASNATEINPRAAVLGSGTGLELDVAKQSIRVLVSRSPAVK